jgi:ATP-dependent DNA ligase
MMPVPTPLPLELKPMEAATTEELPSGAGWQYEPKYDGFRCLAHLRDGSVHLQSRNAKPLERYFPEVASGLRLIAEAGFVVDGELLIPGGSFETLQLRLHPAESRIRLLSEESPAQLVVFDILLRDGVSLLERPLTDRRRELETFIAEGGASPVLRLGEATEDETVARSWLGQESLDGIIAKRRDLPYLPGERAMRKFKL